MTDALNGAGNFFTTYWPLVLGGIFALGLTCFFRRAFHRVYLGPSRVNSLLRLLKGFATSNWTLIPATLAVAVMLGCATTHYIDVFANQHVGKDAHETVEELKLRAQQRLARRCAELLARVNNPDNPSNSEGLPDWARAALVGELPDNDELDDWRDSTSIGNWWAVRPVVAKPNERTGTDKKTGFELLDKIKHFDPDKPSSDPLKKDEDAITRRKELGTAFGDPSRLLEPGLPNKPTFEADFAVLTQLYRDDKATATARPLTRSDINDFNTLFSFPGQHVELATEVRDFLRAPWIGTDGTDVMDVAITREYAEIIPMLGEDVFRAADGTVIRGVLVEDDDESFSIIDIDEREATLPKNKYQRQTFWTSLYYRLGMSYQEPSPRKLSKNLARVIKLSYGEQELSKAPRFRLMMLGFTFIAPASGAAVSRPPAPESYDFSSMSVDEVLIRKLFSSIQEEVAGRIEKRSSGTFPFDLSITYVNQRAIIRGPIQLVTIIVFFWGMLLLFVKVFLLELLAQMSYLVVATRQDRAYDPYDLRWVEIWLCKVGSAANPATRQIVETDSRPNDLFPFLLRRLLLARQAGRAADEAETVIDQAAADWKADHAHEDLFFDFVAWALPSLGFLGTVVGIGQGMGLANKVLTPDPDVQAQTISFMTEQLGTAFYTTLVALVCAFPFTLCYYLASALKNWQIGQFKRLARRFLVTCVEWRIPETPSPTAPLATGKKPVGRGVGWSESVSSDVKHFDELIRGLAVRIDVASQSNARASITSPALRQSQLIQLLTREQVIPHAEANAELIGVWAYSRIWRAAEHLPPRWQEVAHLLYWLEIRKARSELAKYGLSTSQCDGEDVVAACTHDAFTVLVDQLITEFAEQVLPPAAFHKWLKLCRICTEYESHVNSRKQGHGSFLGTPPLQSIRRALLCFRKAYRTWLYRRLESPPVLNTKRQSKVASPARILYPTLDRKVLRRVSRFFRNRVRRPKMNYFKQHFMQELRQHGIPEFVGWASAIPVKQDRELKILETLARSSESDNQPPRP